MKKILALFLIFQFYGKVSATDEMMADNNIPKKIGYTSVTRFKVLADHLKSSIYSLCFDCDKDNGSWANLARLSNIAQLSLMLPDLNDDLQQMSTKFARWNDHNPDKIFAETEKALASRSALLETGAYALLTAAPVPLMYYCGVPHPVITAWALGAGCVAFWYKTIKELQAKNKVLEDARYNFNLVKTNYDGFFRFPSSFQVCI